MLPAENTQDVFYIVFFVCLAHFPKTLKHKCKSKSISSCFLPRTPKTYSILYFSYFEHTSPKLLDMVGSQKTTSSCLLLRPPKTYSILYFLYVEHTSPKVLDIVGSQKTTSSCLLLRTPRTYSILYFSYVEHTSSHIVPLETPPQKHLSDTYYTTLFVC